MIEDTQTDTPPAGWVLHTLPGTFAGHAGPIYRREDGVPGIGFFSKPYHGNLGGVVHGGMLMTLADMALFNICAKALDGKVAVTVSMNADFIRPAPIGVFIVASGEVIGAGTTLLFARGMVRAGEKDLLSFSGTLKRLAPLRAG